MIVHNRRHRRVARRRPAARVRPLRRRRRRSTTDWARSSSSSCWTAAWPTWPPASRPRRSTWSRRRSRVPTCRTGIGPSCCWCSANAALAAGDHDKAAASGTAARRMFRRQERDWFEVQAELTALSARYAGGRSARALLPAATALVERMRPLGVPEMPQALMLAGRLATRVTPDAAPAYFREAAAYRRHGASTTRALGWLATALDRRMQGDGRGVLRACGSGLQALDDYQATLGSTELRALVTVHGEELAATGDPGSPGGRRRPSTADLGRALAGHRPHPVAGHGYPRRTSGGGPGGPARAPSAPGGGSRGRRADRAAPAAEQPARTRRPAASTPGGGRGGAARALRGGPPPRCAERRRCCAGRAGGGRRRPARPAGAGRQGPAVPRRSCRHGRRRPDVRALHAPPGRPGQAGRRPGGR